MTLKQLGFKAPPSLAIAEGATTPSPGIAGVICWSSTLGKLVYWTGSLWTAGASIAVSATAPSSPANGQEWEDLNTGILYTFVDDGSSTAWVELGPGGSGPAGATGAAGTPAGSTSSVQYNNAGAFAGAANVDIVSGDLNLTVATPAAAPAGTVTVFAQSIAGRIMAAMIGPSGLSATLQPFIGRNKIGIWQPPGNATTVPGVSGYTAPTVVGTATARNVATTNFFTRTRRLGFVSAATAGALTENRVAVAQVTIGDGAGLGGFTKVIRFGCSDAATVAGARQFVGISSSTAAATNVEPSTLTNSIGVGHGAADTNLMLYYGGSAAQAAINLGANFPVNTLSVDCYELALFASPNAATVNYMVTRLNTGHVASGVLTAATPGTQLPLNTTLLSYCKAWRTNNATALAVGLDIISDYIETDN